MLKYIKILLVAFILYLFFVEVFSNTFADADLWGYLAFGRAFWETGRFPYHDIFAYTPTKDLWIDHEWLTGIIYYGIFRHAQYAGLQLLRYVLVIVTLCLIYQTAIRRGAEPVFASIAIMPAMLLISFGYVPVRAQIFTYLFFTATLWILESAKRRKRWPVLLWLLPIQILWCNLHGGFVAGIGLIGLYAIGEALSGRKYRAILAAGIAAASVTIINPYGIHYWIYILQAVLMPRPEINEWVSAPGAIKKGLYIFPVILFLIMGFFAAAFFVLRRRRDYTDILVVFFVICIGMNHVRHTVFLGLIFGALLPLPLTESWRYLRENKHIDYIKPWMPAGIFICLFVMLHAIINFSGNPSMVPNFKITAYQSRYPIGALSWIMQKGCKGNILPHFEWGEFILWHCHPFCRVAMDGRYETVYQRKVSREYFDFLYARPTWRVFLREYPHDMILLRAGIAVAELMKREKAWRIAYEDRTSVLFVRKDYRCASGSG